jgi:tRNA-dihydrouridine synthase A
MTAIDRRISVAPMMDWTDRHDRYFLRLISRRVLLYSEMVPVGAIVHGDRRRFLAFHPAEHPVALQLGGAEPDDLACAAEAGAAFGYDEINLNVGCPSPRVQKASFGAALMAEPRRVAEGFAAMRRAVALPLTVKTRTGIDDLDSYDHLRRFVETVAAAGCTTFIIHARKAWLSGLSPKQNREVPPLDYPRVYRLKEDYPELAIVINGGIADLDGVQRHLGRVDGAMLGRAAYQNPYILAEADRRFFAACEEPPSRQEVARAFIPYAEMRLAEGVPLKSMTRHILGLFNGLPGARAWRRTLSEAVGQANRVGERPAREVIEEALAAVKTGTARRAA